MPARRKLFPNRQDTEHLGRDERDFAFIKKESADIRRDIEDGRYAHAMHETRDIDRAVERLRSRDADVRVHDRLTRLSAENPGYPNFQANRRRSSSKDGPFTVQGHGETDGLLETGFRTVDEAVEWGLARARKKPAGQRAFDVSAPAGNIVWSWQQRPESFNRQHRGPQPIGPGLYRKIEVNVRRVAPNEFQITAKRYIGGARGKPEHLGGIDFKGPGSAAMRRARALVKELEAEFPTYQVELAN